MFLKFNSNLLKKLIGFFRLQLKLFSILSSSEYFLNHTLITNHYVNIGISPTTLLQLVQIFVVCYF